MARLKDTARLNMAPPRRRLSSRAASAVAAAAIAVTTAPVAAHIAVPPRRRSSSRSASAVAAVAISLTAAGIAGAGPGGGLRESQNSKLVCPLSPLPSPPVPLWCQQEGCTLPYCTLPHVNGRLDETDTVPLPPVAVHQAALYGEY